MPCQCDSENAGCKCTFTAGLNVVLEGSGTASDPIRVHVAPAYLATENTATVHTTAFGSGDVTDPYLLKMELPPGLYEMKARRWVGSEDDLAFKPPVPGQIGAVISGPNKRLVGLVNLYGGTDRFVRVYVGHVMVADESGGTLGPGI